MPGLFLKFFVIILSILICWYSIRLGSGLLKFLGKDGSQAVSRIMGLLIGAVAIRLIREGIFELII